MSQIAARHTTKNVSSRGIMIVIIDHYSLINALEGRMNFKSIRRENFEMKKLSIINGILEVVILVFHIIELLLLLHI